MFAAFALAAFLSPPGVPPLVEKLGAAEFATREAAGKQLIEVGEPALPALRRATRSTDAEVARRAALLVAAITKRADNARALAPTLVELNVTDQPLGDVLPLLEKQTGYKFQVTGLGKALSTKVTLMTRGKVPFWAALEELAVATNLAVASDYQTATISPDLPQMPFRGGRRPLPQPQQLLVPSSTILLRPRPVKPRPASLSGAVRIEAIPFPLEAFPSLAADTGAVLLQAMPEPKMPWEQVESFWVTKARDDQNRDLPTLVSLDGTVASRVLPAQNGRVVVDAAGNLNVVPEGGTPQALFIPNNAQVFVRLKNANGVKVLKEFEGVIRAVVQAKPEELVAAPLGGVGGGPNGLTLRATIAAVPEEGNVPEFTVKLRYHANDVRFEGGLPSTMETVWVGGGGRGMMKVAGAVVINGRQAPTFVPTLHGLTVTDDAGKPYSIGVVLSRREIDQTTLWIADELKLALKPTEPGQGKPTQVMFAAGRSKTVDIPFALRDVPVTLGNAP